MLTFKQGFMSWISIVLAGLFILSVLSGSKAASQNSSEKTTTSNKSYQTAIFAGGCFWCMEKPFDEVDGVIETVSGYIGGQVKHPTYKQISSGGTGHAEAVKIKFDPKTVSYEKLLTVFWKNIDPKNDKGQFCDIGDQYRSAIFYQNKEQKLAAQQSRKVLQKRIGNIATSLEVATQFYPAEDYHQNYYLKNPIRYKYYRHGCGRDKRLQQLWGEK